jgi:hypothetical protein
MGFFYDYVLFYSSDFWYYFTRVMELVYEPHNVLNVFCILIVTPENIYIWE